MARCKNCGKANRDGALFCQDCGKAFDGAHEVAFSLEKNSATAVSAAIPVSREEASAVPGEVFSAAPSPAGFAEAEPVMQGPGPEPVACDGCGTANPTAASYCRNCGKNLNHQQRPLNSKVSCSHCGHVTPAGFMYCQHCGNRILPESASRQAPVRPRPEPSPSAALVQAQKAQPVPKTGSEAVAIRDKSGLRGQFVLIRRDGTDGEVLALTGESCDLGRATHRCFADDPHLAARHLRVSPSAMGVRVRPLDTVNGVFVQIREPYELSSGDVFFMGRELIRFELLGSDERDLPPVSEQGVRVLGSIARESWGRLRQLTSAAVSRDVWHLSRAETLLGREEGDVVFPDDEFMSRRHALLSRVGGRVRLEDQNSSNGTCVRLRSDREIGPSDILRMGEQVLRYEP